VGLIDDLDEIIATSPQAGDLALVIGETKGHLGRSALLSVAFGRHDGPPPPVDLKAERRNGRFVLENRDRIHAATDLSEGGLALAAFEMAAAAGLGVTIDKKKKTASLFGEDQGRYLIACGFDAAEELMIRAGRAGVPIRHVGRFGGDTVTLGSKSAPLADLTEIWRTSFERALG